jgi:hypothetical protein
VQGTQQLRYCEGKSVEDGLASSRRGTRPSSRATISAEAMAAFFEKRPPKFRGR